MEEALILDMAKKYVKNGSITYGQFDRIYHMLSRKEQYEVSEMLHKNGIELIDGPMGVNVEDINDDEFFEDDDIDADDVVVNMHIKQSNEILCALIQQGNKQAEQDLCVKNKKLVDKCVRGYQKIYRDALDFEDLEQVGMTGLIRAANSFDIHKGYAFSTYAVHWIKQKISREIFDHGFAIRIPVHMMENIVKVSREEGKYEGYGFEDRIRKISKSLEMTEDEVKNCIKVKNNFLKYTSLNTLVGEKDSMELGDMIPEDEELSVEDFVMNEEFKHLIDEILKTLTPREQKVIRLRFGLDDGRTRTLEEIGELFQVTRERIRQIEAKAMRRLRHSSRSRLIRDFLY